MRVLFLLTIKIYWKLIPKAKRRPCIFRTSCSHYVYRKTTKEGFFEGLRALRFRFMNCRSGFQVFEDPIESTVSMILPNGQVIPEGEISERFIK
ncbi:putative component of membrane protein insertase Oxa1/YidC/SpoIIIJ protein YidD [Pedobacter africanus]|uniref:Component of membrane protein insertase Oxa1/YidC/SpoIIIJ protein YidD n=1 Tax=Pedobacter africanus TaxID=151894 RepID=A0ACC6KRS0_9SPHI|nr:putative component of membrane protein insertase Oxa1/YidC/SpoIIIJ protein YidD [Pedobacter africanus]